MSSHNRLHRRSLRSLKSDARRHFTAQRRPTAQRRLDMESLEDRRLLVADLNFAGEIVVPDNYQPTSPIVEQAAEVSFHGSDMQGKDGPLAPIGMDLAILFHEQQQFGDSLPPSNLQLQVQNNRVAIDVTASGNVASLKSQLSSIGMEVLGETDRQVTGRIPISALDNLAGLSSVAFARPAYRQILHAGPTNTEGDQAHNSDLARQKWAVDGSGITVGVISDSYNALADPANLATTGAGLDQSTCVGVGFDCELVGVNVIQEINDPAIGTDEGRAMLQIVHDIAPGADLAFASSGGVGSEILAADNTRALSDAGVDVIVDDIGFATTPFYQDGIWAQAVDEVTDDGTVYVSAAGNFGTNAWEGSFVDSGLNGPLGGSYNDFNPGSESDGFIEIAAPAGTGIQIVLQWDQPFGSLSTTGNASQSDLDLYLFGADQRTRLDFSVDNNIGGDPIEIINFTNAGTADLDADGFADEVFYLAVSHQSGPAPNIMKFIALEGEITEYETNSATAYGHPLAADAITVAAADFRLTPAFGVSPPIANDFSALANGQILFDVEGNRLPAAETRLKPDVTGVDGVTTTVTGFEAFSGTSAAAPHVAGIIALMLDNAGGPDSLSPAQVKSILQASAIDITHRMDPFANPVQFSLPSQEIPNGVGFDFYTGFGLVDAAVALSTTVGLDTGPGSISGTIFEDADGDGRHDNREGGVAGWSVYIDLDGDDVQDIVEPSAVTDANGNYTLTDLPFGDYTVNIGTQDGWMMTAPSTVGQSVSLGINEDATGVDFGLRQQFSSVVGTVFNDLDFDGVRDAGEVGIADAIIRWDQDGDGVISLLDPAVFTNSNGEYLIDGLDGGQLLVQLTPLAGWVSSGDAETLVPLSPGDTVFGVNFGLRPNFVDPGVIDPDPNDNPPDPNTGPDTTTGFVDGFILGQQFAANDGVVFVSGLHAGTTEQVVVIASQLSVSRGYLHAWIDFNGDGELSASEQILRNHRLEDGVNLVPVDIPAGASATDVLARFRWDFELNEQADGPSLGGEIEDYLVSIPMDADARLVAGDDVIAVAEDSVDNVVTVLDNDSVGPLGGITSISMVGDAQNGVTSLTDDGQVLYSPNADFNGTDEFDYVLTDGMGNFTMGHVTVAVTPVNDPPVANDDNFEVVSESILLSLDVLANDNSGPDTGETLMISDFTSPSRGGQLSLSQNGSFLIYTPSEGFVGNETFTYTLVDGNGGSDTANVTIDVTPAPPLVQFDLETTDANGTPISTVNVGETFFLTVSATDIRETPEGLFSAYLDVFYDDASIVSVTGDAIDYNDVDFPNDQRGSAFSSGLIDEAGAVGRNATSGPISAQVFRVPFVATSTGLVNFSGDPSDILPTNEVSLIGRDEAVPNRLVLFDNASINIVGAVDDTFVVDEDSQANVLDILLNDVGVAGTTLTITDVSTTAQGGTLVNQGGNVLYTPPTNFFGTDSFTYTTQDTSGRNASASVTVNVTPVNDDPTAVDDTFKIAPNSLNIVFDVLQNDFITPDINENISIVAFGVPDNGGSVIISGDGGGLIYTPESGFDGTETFTYTISDGNGGSDTATVTVDVNALVGFRLEVTDINGNPISSTRVGDQFQLNVYVEDLRDDPSGVFSGYLDVLYSANLVSANGPISYEGSVYQSGQSGDTDQPGIINEAGSTDGNTPLGGGEFFLLTVPLIAQNQGIATFDGSPADILPLHEVTVFGVSNVIETDLIRYGSTTLDIRLEGAVSDSFAVSEDSQANTLDVLANDVVLPTREPLTIVSVSQGSAGGTIGIVDGSTLSYTPAANFFGSESFVYTIEDVLGESTQATVNVNVIAQNDNPTVGNDAFTIIVDSTDNTLDVLANDSILPDAGETLSILNVGAPNQGGSVQIAAGGGSLVYSPPAGFAGTETLTYTVTDGNGGSTDGIATITVEPEVIEPVAAFNLVFTDEDGTPIESVDAGDSFQLRVFVQDVRPDDPQGVFSAYMDIVYAGSANPMITGVIDFNDDVYPSTQSGDTSVSGMIDELGAVDGISSLRTGDPILLATIPMTATSGGMITATSDPAEQNPPNETTLFGLNRVVADAEIVFGMDTLTVNGAVASAAPFMNTANPYDVNDDNAISPIDALLVINQLGNELPRIAAQSSDITRSTSLVSPTAYVDVNGDNVVSPLDALMVINQIGQTVAVAAAAPLGLEVEVVEASSDAPANRAIPTDSYETAEDRGESRLNQPFASLDGSAERNELDSSLRSWHQARRNYGPSRLAVDTAMEDMEGILEDVAEDIMDAWRA